MINARQLEVLSTVIEVGTTARAAEILNVSQPAISNMIRHTESVTGLTLFERDRGRLIPTREARHIAQEAQHLFMQQKRIRTIVAELREGTIGTLAIVASPSIGLGVLPKALASFAAQRPKVRVSLELGSIDEITELLASGRADIGFSITVSRHPSLSVTPLAEGRLVCVCPRGHDLTQVKKVKVTDLNLMPHISYAAATPLGRLVDQVFAERGLERRYGYEVRHTATALEMVAAGIGVALVDNFALIGREDPRIVARETDPLLPIRISSITPRLFPASNVTTAFMEHFRSFVAAPA
ncbi:DNA-binding transcriptional regulator, LysR family [Tistlia consotensis]|uniref:DNA-binding transcriptional regulator, LysR family n=1 Tax=Tistlia consotensis USBA 355 TaxID=560819 RepID=A0A1Y6B543_9PROT|nr:LysR family transcriptional regulator [Tistlia consotensis]SME92657.1 DNA-binding transcriptional regulator, LysR family [Tistlia consotensis USBA 355]SNR28163.1 DNA-binding transcriptional regulator, LysR family [Tistlia consotensis]